MDIKVAEVLLEQVKKAKELYENACSESFKRRCSYGGDKVAYSQEEIEEANKDAMEKYNIYNALEHKFNDYVDKLIEIQEPESIIGGRTLTGYQGRLKELFVCDLANIPLSDREEGTIVMPYEFNLEGKATKVIKSKKYKIKRIDGKVYLVTKLDYFI